MHLEKKKNTYLIDFKGDSVSHLLNDSCGMKVLGLFVRLLVVEDSWTSHSVAYLSTPLMLVSCVELPS